MGLQIAQKFFLDLNNVLGFKMALRIGIIPWNEIIGQPHAHDTQGFHQQGRAAAAGAEDDDYAFCLFFRHVCLMLCCRKSFTVESVEGAFGPEKINFSPWPSMIFMVGILFLILSPF
ncbi:MAG TPA: hypothetical protein ENN39_05745 [Desulfonatronum sp.]|nr:hypothetical protein [Desulfonatronum sp.]